MNSKPDKIQPPQALDAERSVLGSILKDPTVLDKITPVLKYPADFYAPKHQIIYQAMLDLMKQNEATDVTMVASHLQKLDRLDKVGGRVYIWELTEDVASTANVVSYAEVVLERSTLRRLIAASNEIVNSCYSQELPAGDLLSQAESTIFRLSDNGHQNQLVSMADLLPEHIDQVMKIDPKQPPRWLETRIADLNKKIVGLFRGEMVIIAGPPSMGKTILALDTVFYNATLGHSVVYFNIDQTNKAIMDRLVIGATGVLKSELYSGKMTESQEMAVAKACAKITMKTKTMYVCERADLSALDIWSYCRRLKRQQGLDMVAIDYLQQLKPPGRFETRNLEVTESSRMLKAMAKELDIVLIAVSQLNRSYKEARIDPDKGQWGWPQTSHLRDSGSLEQDANVILFPWVPREILKDRFGERSSAYLAYMKQHPEWETQAFVVIGKNKDGPTGTVECRRDVEKMRFHSETDRRM